MEAEDISLFEPFVNEMFFDYPELKEYDEFKELTQRELKLCWFLGNPTSPLAKAQMSKRQKLKRALTKVYGKLVEKRKDVKEMLEGEIPEKIIIATHRMASFRPSVRLIARFTTEYIFDKLNEIIEVSQEDMTEMDFDDRTKYSQLIIKISESLPSMIQRMEGGFGLIIKKKKSKSSAKVKVSIQDIR